MKKHIYLIAFTLLTTVVVGQTKTTSTNTLKTTAQQDLDKDYTKYKDIALKIWGFAEVGYKEKQSSDLLEQTLEQEGFQVEKGVAGIPTAFVATYGSGSPVIGILAEYDALPGLSQEVATERKPIANQVGGHGCGHHLFGTASVAAGIAIKKLLEAKKITGTIKVFGCPAEEGGSGKVYLTREGVFNGLDVVLHWHPGSGNSVSEDPNLANISAKFRFKGLSAHAAASPENGRSSLDAVEAMNYMVNMMREHVTPETRIHYVITSGGKAPNVVPDFAEVYYYVRHPKRDEVKRLFDRVVKAAQAGALGTETEMSYEIIGGTHELLYIPSLNVMMQKEFQAIGGVSYNEQETEFAKQIQKTFTHKYPDITSVTKIEIKKDQDSKGRGSTDVGDVSFAVPTVGIRVATWVAGTPAHSWQAVACGGMEIGTKGMILAAKVLTSGAIELFQNKALIQAAKKEFQTLKGDYNYSPLLGNRPPALNYRD